MKKQRKNFKILSILIFITSCSVFGQQIPDTSFTFSIYQKAYPENQGPLVVIDEGHNNLHTSKGSFSAFRKLLEQDGYRVLGKNVDPNQLEDTEIKILVIANALNKVNVGNWTLPTPSAFTDDEISKIRDWVHQGGRLLLIADHMPFAGAVEKLGEAFGFEFINGFAMTSKNFWPPSVFSIKNGGLINSKVNKGNLDYEEVNSVTTFTGSAFKIPKEAVPVIKFSKEHHILQPETAWAFNENTSFKKLEDYFQGAVLPYGEGKVAVFGEAAMFTAQVTNENTKAGFNSEFAPNNAQFTLNLIHWLDGITDYSGPIEENLQNKEKEKENILQLNKEMETAFHENDYTKVASFYSDKAVMTGNRHEVKGRESIDKYWSGLKGRGISWNLENVDLDVYDHIAIQRGISRMRFIHDGEEHLSEVRFTLVWKRIDGIWKITIDHYSLL